MMEWNGRMEYWNGMDEIDILQKEGSYNRHQQPQDIPQ